MCQGKESEGTWKGQSWDKHCSLQIPFFKWKWTLSIVADNESELSLLSLAEGFREPP